ncbi:hypothetical protein EZV62_016280 [Acer yangbiense]|uniref:S-adenosylmethionine synthase n=1 Tax=Acer yangbiense TaxID=1000413 RepID=A0A5C7HN30_9ROSI|nr:hypothetical protein EZV62_016280 [Acer yangbiense]
MALVNSSATLCLNTSSSLLPTSSIPISPAFLPCPLSSTTSRRGLLSLSFALKEEAVEASCGYEAEQVEEEEMEESRETLLYSLSPLPLLFVAALPGAGTVRSLFGPFVEIVKSLNLPDWLAVVLFAMGGYGTYLGFRIRFSDDVEEKAKAKDLHPKLLGGMFFFFALGATGGVTSLLTSDKPIFESPHAVTGFIGLTLLTIQTILPSLFEGKPELRNVHGILGSGIMTLFLVHAALGLQLGLNLEFLEMETFLFTSESVNEGHPDKLCDQVSDAILDACLEQDPESKVACETCTKTNMVMVFGEITTKATVNYEKIVRDTCRGIGFVSADVGLDADNCKVLVNIEQQSPDIAQGVHGHLSKKPEEIGAGDQGHMFGYATDETPEFMPLTHVLATKLGAKLTEVRKNKTCPWLRPDGKTQVTVEYHNDGGAMIPTRVHTVLISTQHDETVTNDQIAKDLKEHVIKPVIPAQYLDDNTIFHLNPSGRFVIGGPHGDAGLTGRKIIIDTYGGWGAHGGGAFSGKDPTKVDRSGAYIVRQAAKSIVASGLARRCIVQVSYAIGVPEPLSVFVDTYKTGKIPDKDILVLIKENFDFRPGMIAINLDLKRGGNFRYQKSAAYGHFGREDPDFTWETVKHLKPKA